jgi:hypothetical protein
MAEICYITMMPNKQHTSQFKLEVEVALLDRKR